MNKIFKSKWNVNTQSYVACSELTRNAGKITTGISILAAALATSLPSTSHAVTCVAKPNGTYDVGFGGADTRCDTIPDSTVTVTENYPWFVLTRTDLRTTLNIGNINYTATGGKGPTIIGNQYALGSNGAKINVGNITAILEGTEGPDAIGSHSGVDITAQDVSIVSTMGTGYTGGNSSGGVAAYGILAGSSNDSGESNANLNGTFTTITINNLTLDQTTKGGKVLPVLNSGLRAIQAGSYGSNNGTSGKIVINEQLNMHLKGERIEGIYVSGSATSATGEKAISTVELNNSNIIAETSAGGNATESAVIKIGKTRDIKTGEGLVVSKGTLNIDSSNLRGGSAIKLYASGSEFKADGNNSATNILTRGSAIEISPRDWQNPTSAADGIKVSMKNANLNTTSNTASLIKVYENQTNTQINISGDDSILTAAQNGWLLEVGASDGGSTSTVAGSTTANFTGGKYFGLTTLSDATRANPSSLTINLDGANTKWYLKEKGTTTQATFTTLNIANGATVDATGAFTPASKTINLFNGKTMNVADNANITETALTANKTFTLKGAVNNNGGVLNLANTEATDMPAFINTLKIDGNYAASGNALVRMNTGWNAPGSINGDDSISDVLHITGTASGVTRVKAIGKDGTEDIINGSIQQIAASELNTVPVIRVDSNNDGSSFIGTARTSGAGMAVLTSRDNAGVREYYWTIHSRTGVVYDPVVPGYALAGKTGLELGYTQLGTLHERRGENQTLAWDNCGTCGEKAKGPSWGRIFGKHLEVAGKTRLGAKHNIWGFQLGHDFAVSRTQEGGHRLTGAYIGYATTKTKYSDIFHTDVSTGQGKQQGWNLGITHTRYAPNGAYVDLVGQVGFLNNKFNANNGVEAKQKGTALSLSAEVGRPYALREHKANEGGWLMEPQAQLIYQGLKLKAFDDGVKQVAGGTHHGLRGRVGVRFAYNTQTAENNYRTNSFYVIANILQDFKNGKEVQIGQDLIKETQAKTWAELGLGGQLPVGKQSYVYADTRYERNLGGAKREGYRGTVGFKYTWK
ncbi:autotransporter outer membrane beta-barrel domain-containing protein [Glaesserella parasuis]|nr:autotransporter outer membrane beta-barrel domain-containing protein [Glaesserella parasuis]